MNPPRRPQAYTARKKISMTIIATTPAAMMSPASRAKNAKFIPLPSSSADDESGCCEGSELMRPGYEPVGAAASPEPDEPPAPGAAGIAHMG